MNCVRPAYASIFVYRIFTHYSLRTRALFLCRNQTCDAVLWSRSTKLLTVTRNVLEDIPRCTQRLYCSASNKKNDVNKHKERVRQELKTYLKQHRVRLRDTEQRIKETGNVIIKDIKETRDKVKERVGEIIEVTICTVQFSDRVFSVPFFVERECVHNTKFVVCIKDIVVAFPWNADY